MQITIREPGSAITHYIGMMLSVFAGALLIGRAYVSDVRGATTAMLIFILAMIGLYGASTIYHTVDVKAGFLKIFQKLDHMMIFVLIAGTYTPICLLVLPKPYGNVLLIVIWSLAITGMVLKGVWITCPKWFSSVIYIAMGWACLAVFPQLKNSLTTMSFSFLVAGGVIYTVGGIIYAIKPKKFNLVHPNFGTHEIFHLFVMGGSACHFITMYSYLLSK